MVESRKGFFEAHRHVLRSLQQMAGEEFPLAKHIVELKRDIAAPTYVKEQPLRDLRFLYAGHESSTSIDLLDVLPGTPCELDTSQLEALQRILTKSLALIQGPPGAGKTYVSVIALQIMLQSMTKGPPIIVAAHTNHALDQLLRHCLTPPIHLAAHPSRLTFR